MTPEQAKKFEALLADEVNAQLDLIRARNRAAASHIALVGYVSSLVPAGTSDTLDIPAFLRVQVDAPDASLDGVLGDDVKHESPSPGCNCTPCQDARASRRLQET